MTKQPPRHPLLTRQRPRTAQLPAGLTLVWAADLDAARQIVAGFRRPEARR